MRALMTDLDWDTFKQCYYYDEMKVIQLHKSEAGYLPTEMIETILDYFQYKTSLKGLPDSESLYVESKQFVNSIYGVFVTKIISAIIDFEDGGWTSKEPNDMDFVNMLNQTKEEDSFTKLKNERKKALEQALDAVEETLKKEGLTDAQKAAAAEQAAAVSRRVEQENAVETLLSAKGFSKVLVIIGEKDVNVVVEKKPDMAAIAQIRDAVASKTDFNASDVKIISAEQ
jgi:hypothetical protein